MNFRTAITLQALKLAAVAGLYAMTVPVLLGVTVTSTVHTSTTQPESSMTKTTVANAEIEVRADFAQAADLIQFRAIGDEEWRATPFQVADARHDEQRALRLVDDWLEG